MNFWKRSCADKNQVFIDFKKVVEVAVSCLTAYQCDGAEKLVEVYMRKYSIAEKRPFLSQVCPKLLEYLHDTKEHCLRGEHYPEWNNGKVLTTHPDINRYTESLLTFRIKNY